MARRRIERKKSVLTRVATHIHHFHTPLGRFFEREREGVKIKCTGYLSFFPFFCLETFHNSPFCSDDERHLHCTN